MKRQPIFAIFSYMSKYIWLALIPLIRAIFSLNFEHKYFSKFIILDIFLLVFVLAIAFFRWYFTRYSVCKNEINIRTGVFLKSSFAINFRDVSTYSFTANVLYKMLGLRLFTVRTSRVSYLKNDHGYDVKILVSYKEYSYIYDEIINSSSESFITYNVNNFKLLLFSILFSSVSSGTFYAIITFLNLRRFLGDITLSYIAVSSKKIHEQLMLIADDIPPIVLFGIILVVGAFLFSFFINFFKYFNFTVSSTSDMLMLKNGFFTTRNFLLTKEQVNCVYLRQSLVMKIIGVVSAGLGVIGYSKPQKEMAVLFPIGRHNSVKEKVEKLLPSYDFTSIKNQISSRSVFRYALLPSFFAVAILLAEFLAMVYFIKLYELIFLVGTAILIADVYYLIVSTVAFLTSGASANENMLTIKSYRHFRFYIIKIPYDKLVAIKLKQSLFQRIFGSCDIIFYPKSSRSRGLKLKALNYKNAMKFLAIINSRI